MSADLVLPLICLMVAGRKESAFPVLLAFPLLLRACVGWESHVSLSPASVIAHWTAHSVALHLGITVTPTLSVRGGRRSTGESVQKV